MVKASLLDSATGGGVEMKKVIVYNTVTKLIITNSWLDDDTRPMFISPDLQMVEFDTQAEADRFIADNNLVALSEMG